MIELGYRKLYPSVVPGIGTGRSAPGRMQKKHAGNIPPKAYSPHVFPGIFFTHSVPPPDTARMPSVSQCEATVYVAKVRHGFTPQI